MTEWTRRLLIVEDESLVAALLSDVFQHAGFAVRVASNVIEAKAEIAKFDPDAALLDISLGEGPTGLDLAHFMNQVYPHIAIVFLTRHPDRRTAGLGAHDVPARAGFLRKDMVSDAEYLLKVIDQALVATEETVRHDLLANRPLAALTSNQLSVLRSAAMGKTNAAIARERGTSERAVEMIMQGAFKALGISNSAEVNSRVLAVTKYIEAVGMPFGSGADAS